MAFFAAPLFTDHMVLQRNLPVPVWGRVAPGARVKVAVAGQTVEGTADGQGRWRVDLSPLAAGGPFEMTIACGGDRLVLKNVLVGEVWIGSGQSNMDVSMLGTTGVDTDIPAADFPDLRLFTVPKLSEAGPQERFGCHWEVCTPTTVRDFSGTLFYFGRELQQRLGVPVGVINSSLGGSMAEPWVSREGLLSEPIFKHLVDEADLALNDYPEALRRFRVALTAHQDKYLPKDPGNSGFPQGWADPAFDASRWGTMNLPCTWQTTGLNFNGVLWFRREVEVPAAWVGKDLELCVGICDDFDTTYFNNEVVGKTGPETPESWTFVRTYTVPGKLVKAGRNLIAVRVFDHFGGGGMTGPAPRMQVVAKGVPGAQPIPLVGDWRFQVERNFGLVSCPPAPWMPLGPNNPSSPFSLFDSMIAPLAPFAIRGFLWYQGESNAGRGAEYRKLLPTLIRDWRKHWHRDDLPFHIVQLPNFGNPPDEPAPSPWAELREAQLMTLSVPHTGMAVAIDIGEANDIHPHNKRDVGKRLALIALAKQYCQTKLVYSGPLFASAKVEGKGKNKGVRLRFDHVSSGLVARDGKLTGFAIAGADKKFVWAEARIDGNTVVVSSPKVAKPVAVRYAWADNPPCSLANREGLPASPFRTDDWPE
jgi:sialate O-acetylesterase